MGDADAQVIAMISSRLCSDSSQVRSRAVEDLVRLAEQGDVHVDAARNRRWLARLRARPEDTLIVAGDVGTSLEDVGAALVEFRALFKHVFYVPGNHELWVLGDEGGDADGPTDSVDKFFRVLRLCDELGVHTSPAWVGETLVVPLFSWYKRTPGARDAGALEYFDGACAVGSHSAVGSNSTCAACKVCPDDEYAATACIKGDHATPGANTVCEERTCHCHDGTHAKGAACKDKGDGSDHQCESCKAGFELTETDICAACPSGFWSPANTDGCGPCTSEEIPIP